MFTPEGKTKELLKRYFKKRGLYAFWPVQTGYGAATIDCLACMDGDFWAIECKREGVEEPTPRQRAVMGAVRAAGGITYLVTTERGKLKWIEIEDVPAAGSGS